MFLNELSTLAALTAAYSFLIHAKEDFQKLSGMHENMEKLYQNVMRYFAIDLKKVSVEEFLTDLNNFRMMFMVWFVYLFPNISYSNSNISSLQIPEQNKIIFFCLKKHLMHITETFFVPPKFC